MDIMYCCQACPPMHFLAMDALLLCIRCCDMCLPVCYLALDDLLLLDARWLERLCICILETAQSVTIFNACYEGESVNRS
jgi:hypothetical protein